MAASALARLCLVMMCYAMLCFVLRCFAPLCSALIWFASVCFASLWFAKLFFCFFGSLFNREEQHTVPASVLARGSPRRHAFHGANIAHANASHEAAACLWASLACTKAASPVMPSHFARVMVFL